MRLQLLLPCCALDGANHDCHALPDPGGCAVDLGDGPGDHVLRLGLGEDGRRRSSRGR